MNDAGSLQNLNDIVVHGPLAWWPLAPGWYVLLGMGLVMLLVLTVLHWRRWRRNRYRRQALAELSSIRTTASAECMRGLPELLKRAALSVWKREEVASLSGQEWHRFLDRTAGMELFSAGVGEMLDRLAYGDIDLPTDQESGFGQVLDAAETWLKRHVGPVRGS